MNPQELAKIQNEAHRLQTMSAHYLKVGDKDLAVNTLFTLSNFYRSLGMKKEAQEVLNQVDKIEI